MAKMSQNIGYVTSKGRIILDFCQQLGENGV